MSFFQTLDISSIEKIRPFTQSGLCVLHDYTLSVMLLWADFFTKEYCIEDEVLYVTYRDPETSQKYYMLPLFLKKPSVKQIKKAVDRILDFEDGKAFISPVSSDWLDHPVFHLCQTTSLPRDCYDYLYYMDDIRALRGDKYNSQRKYVNRFKREHTDWAVRELTESDSSKIMTWLMSTYKGQMDENYGDYEYEELRSVRKMLKRFKEFRFFGKYLTIGEEIIGFAIGEVIGDVLYLHVKKADKRYPGAYQMLEQQFVLAHEFDAIYYVNREEDAGDAGIRAAKLGNHPCRILRKHVIQICR